MQVNYKKIKTKYYNKVGYLHLIGASNDLATVTITFVPKTYERESKNMVKMMMKHHQLNTLPKVKFIKLNAHTYFLIIVLIISQNIVLFLRKFIPL